MYICNIFHLNIVHAGKNPHKRHDGDSSQRGKANPPDLRLINKGIFGIQN